LPPDRRDEPDLAGLSLTASLGAKRQVGAGRDRRVDLVVQIRSLAVSVKLSALDEKRALLGLRLFPPKVRVVADVVAKALAQVLCSPYVANPFGVIREQIRSRSRGDAGLE
jgi:hypothetical protein